MLVYKEKGKANKLRRPPKRGQHVAAEIQVKLLHRPPQTCRVLELKIEHNIRHSGVGPEGRAVALCTGPHQWPPRVERQIYENKNVTCISVSGPDLPIRACPSADKCNDIVQHHYME